MENSSDGVVLESFNSPSIAAMVVEVLKGKGIASYVRGGMLQDPVALSRQAMNVQSVKVFVHPNDLERARGIIQGMREAGKELKDPKEE